MKLCVIGDSGLLGQALVQAGAAAPENEVLGLSTSAFGPTAYWKKLAGKYRHEICNLLIAREWFLYLLDTFKPDLVVNCMALTNLADCEKDHVLAERLNAELPAWLAQVCAARKTTFVHISTDQVFDGRKGSGYTEGDAPNPLNIYGRTKLRGERLVLENNSDALVIRTNIVGFKDQLVKPAFAEWLSTSFEKREKITLFTDYVTCSFHVADLSRLILEAYGKKLKGLWHMAASTPASKLEFGMLFAKEAGFDTSNVKAGSVKTSNLIPERPSYAALDVKKAEKALSQRLPTTEETVKKLAEEYQLRKKEVCRA